MSPRISSPAHPSGGGGRNKGRGGFTRRDTEIIGKTIKITRGPYKGILFFGTTSFTGVFPHENDQ